MKIEIEQDEMAEPVTVKHQRACKACGQLFTPTTSHNYYCDNDDCIKHRHVVRQVEYQRRHSSGRPAGRPKGSISKAPRKNGVAPEARSHQLKYYYRKKAGKVTGMETKLKTI